MYKVFNYMTGKLVAEFDSWEKAHRMVMQGARENGGFNKYFMM